ncbi:Protein AIM2 [Cyberlindnera fabianii]|uniref:Protein AIM2 n=1 Tax=Cyberlindnera fabianii TaxID=36022 RepID=A0A1V2L045_CYBFA|nr:Protein AIM2 [Cyberlindnera fabianii]
MASLPPSKCCTETVDKNGTTTGDYIDLYGVNCYVSGVKSDKVVVITTDIFGHTYKNNMLIADGFAAAGYYTIIPDLFDGKPFRNEDFSGLMPWLSQIDLDAIHKLVDKFFKDLNDDLSPTFIGAVGHCFGALFATRAISKGKPVTCAAVAHPSWTDIKDVEAITKPLLISAAEDDPRFTPELRALTEKTLKEIKATYQLDLFSGCSHGYAVRGDESIPSVKYAKDKTFHDQVYWFNHWSNN